MLEIGRRGNFTVQQPYSLEGDYTVTAIVTIDSLQAMGIDVYAKAYAPAGVSKDAFKLVDRNSELYVMKGIDIKYIPTDKIIHTDTQSTVKYVDKALVTNLGALPAGYDFNSLVAAIGDVVARLGIKSTVSVKDISKPTFIPLTTHQERLKSIEVLKENKTVSTLSLREDEITQLNTKLAALQGFVGQYLKDCKQVTCCSSTTAVVDTAKVYYNYSLADYYLQASRGDVHDAPTDNIFISRLHDMNVNSNTYQDDKAIPVECQTYF